MKNINRFFAMFALVLGVMGFFGCTQPADGDYEDDESSAPDSAVVLVEYGTNKSLDVKVDNVGFEGSGSVIPYFSKGALRYIADVGMNNTGTLAVVSTAGSDISSEGYISAGWNQAIYFAYLPDGKSNWEVDAKLAVLEVRSNKDYYSKFNVKVSSFDDPGIYLGLLFKKLGTTYYGKTPGGSAIRYLFLDTKDDWSSYPTSTTGYSFSGQIPVQSYKYLLISYWPRGTDQTDASLAQRGYIEVDGNSFVPSAKSASGGFGYTSGQNVSMNIGDKVTFFVAESGVSELYYYVSQSAAEPSDKASVFSGRQNVASNGYISIDVTYSGGLIYLFSWTKSSSGAYSSFFKLIVTQGGGGSTTTNSVQSISLPATMTVNMGGTGTLTAIFNPSGATNQSVNWTVSGTAATINSTTSNVVTITPVSAGTVTITATAQDQTAGVKTDSCLVTVTGGQVVTTQKYAYLDTSWSGQKVQISGTLYTVGSDGKIPFDFSSHPTPDVSTVINGIYGDARGVEGQWSRITSWNGDTATLTSYRNGGMMPTGGTTTWTIR